MNVPLRDLGICNFVAKGLRLRCLKHIKKKKEKKKDRERQRHVSGILYLGLDNN